MRHGLIPFGVSLRTGRQAVFFTVVNPMDNQDDFVLRANSQSGSQDLQDHLGNRNRMRRVPGISISTVTLQDARRQNNVTKLIEMFEKTSA